MPRALLAILLTFCAQLPEGLRFELCLCALVGHDTGACAPEVARSCCGEGERDVPEQTAEGGTACACCWVLETRIHEDGTRTSPERTSLAVPPRSIAVTVAPPWCGSRPAVLLRNRELLFTRRAPLPLRI